MNIEQVKKDLQSNILVSKATLLKLAEAALMLENVAIDAGFDDVLEAVDKL